MRSPATAPCGLGETARPRGLRGRAHQVLDQEKSTDQKLTRIAESKVNTKAA